MDVAQITPIGWVHSMLCLVALALGARNLSLEKGTQAHRHAGQWYVASMVVLNVSALFIYRIGNVRVQGFMLDRFSVFHWMAVATLAAVGLAYVAARRQDRALFAYAHPAAMIFSYYMLVGGAMNEAFVHVRSLQRFGFVHVPGTQIVIPGPAIGVTQFIVMLLAFAVLTYFMAQVAAYRAREKRGLSPAAAE